MSPLVLWVLVLVLCSSSTCASGNDNASTLVLAVFLPLSSPDVNGYSFLPSLDITLDLINSRSDLLPGFTLDAEVTDSAVS